MPNGEHEKRDTTRVKNILTGWAHALSQQEPESDMPAAVVQELVKDLGTAVQILEDMDARTGRRDPTERAD